MAQEFLGGEWRKDGAKDRAQWEGRRRFLRAVERVAPKCLKDLEGSPLEAFTDAHAETRPPPRKKPPRRPEGIAVTVQEDPPWVRWRFENDDWDDLNDQDPLVMALHEEIRAWGERWNLSWGKRRKLWLLDVALLSLRLWHQGHPWEPEYPFFLEDPFVKGRFADPRFVDTDDKAELVLPAWHPMWEPWSTYEKKVQRKLAKYRLKREAWAKSQGMKPGTKKRGDVDKHFEWLAHHQVLEKSYETIAKEFRVKQNAVAKAVRKTAKLIGLKLREVGPGMRNK